MSTILLSKLANASGGEIVGADLAISGYSTDTRTIAKGDTYFCLRGDNFDGHDFINDAIAKGAGAIVCEGKIDSPVIQLVVSDCKQAFGLYANLWREQFSMPVIGVTGSNGKTTVKQLLASIFAVAGNVHFTRANDNNEVGVPQTLLGLAESHDYAVIEMGASHLGEIEWLGQLVQPSVSLITNASAAHLEGFGDAQSVAAEKAWIYKSLSDDGTAVINADSEFCDYWKDVCANNKIITFGAAGDVKASRNTDGSITIAYLEQSVSCEFPLAGQHNVQNAAAAAACGIAAGLPLEAIGKGLAVAESVSGRLNFISLVNGVTVIDDTYNANPASVRAAIDVLAEAEGKRFMVLGDLGELGAEEVAMHHSLGEYAKAHKVDRLMAVGTLSKNSVAAFGAGADSYQSKESLVKALTSELQANSTVLVKGSRSMKMEEVVAGVCGAIEKPQVQAGVSC